MAPPLRIVMLGTGDFALPTFLHLLDTGHIVVALITQPDRPQGRMQQLIPSGIKVAAIERNVPVLQPEDVNAPEGLAAVRSLDPDLLVTAAYGQILSAELLGVPRMGGINLHGSLLPSYRGAAPVARAIQRGESESGVTVILMTPRIDAGGMLKIARTPIDPNETAGALEDRLSQIGAPLIEVAIAELHAGAARVIPQRKAKVTKAPKLRKEDGLIDWTKSARAVHDQVRAMQPWPGAYSYLRRDSHADSEPVRILIHKTMPVDSDSSGQPGGILEAGDHLVVAAGQGAVRLVVIQVVGKKPMAVADVLRGHPMAVGDRFGTG